MAAFYKELIMKQIKLITLAISLVLLTARIAAAFCPPEDRCPFGVKHLQMMQAILNLTDEQSTVVENMFTDVRKNTQVIIKNYNLQNRLKCGPESIWQLANLNTVFYRSGKQ